MTCAVATEEALGIEYDEQTACDVCRDVSFHLWSSSSVYISITLRLNSPKCHNYYDVFWEWLYSYEWHGGAYCVCSLNRDISFQ